MPHKDKEVRLAYHRLYYIANKEKNNERNRLQRQDDEVKERLRLYNLTPSRQRINRKSRWKARGVIFDDDDDYWYDRYIQSKKCEVCANEYKSSFDRCLDHDHTITDAPNVRQILCKSCNNWDSWKTHSEWV